MLYFETGRRDLSMKEVQRALELDSRLVEAHRLSEALEAGLTPSTTQ